MAAETTFRGDPSTRTGPAPAWVLVVKWVLLALVVAFGAYVSWRLVEQGHVDLRRAHRLRGDGGRSPSTPRAGRCR